MYDALEMRYMHVHPQCHRASSKIRRCFSECHGPLGTSVKSWQLSRGQCSYNIYVSDTIVSEISNGQEMKTERESSKNDRSFPAKEPSFRDEIKNELTRVGHKILTMSI